MLASDAGELSFVLGETNIVDGHTALTALFHLLRVEEKGAYHHSLQQVEDCHPTITLHSSNVDAGVAEGKIEDGIVQFQTLSIMMSTYLTCASTICHTFILQSSPAETAKLGFLAKLTL